LCIHRAPLGTHERFIGFLIEHYAGNFPLWLAPDQVRVITLNDDEALIEYARPIVAELRANMVRVDSDFSATPFKAKIANAECRGSYPPTHVGGYGWSSAVATWKPARSACVCTTAARKARSRRRRSCADPRGH
jgi:threonyl-tRNA synthetase